MEIQPAPRWHLSLRQDPEILAMGASMVGRLEVEVYNPVPYWQIGFFEGSTTVELSKAGRDWQLAIRPNDVFVIPPHAVRRYVTRRRLLHYYLAFRFPTESALADCVELPAIIPTGSSAGVILGDLTTMIDLRESDPFESELLARLVLWRLVRLARQAESAHQGGEKAVQASLETIRENIADGGLTAETLARNAGLSRRRLDQLFVRTVGKPISACIRDRRAQLAADLLQQTALPIRMVGAHVGIHDPHAFNKFIRRYCGQSPSAVRARKSIT